MQSACIPLFCIHKQHMSTEFSYYPTCTIFPPQTSYWPFKSPCLADVLNHSVWQRNREIQKYGRNIRREALCFGQPKPLMYFRYVWIDTRFTSEFIHPIGRGKNNRFAMPVSTIRSRDRTIRNLPLECSIKTDKKCHHITLFLDSIAWRLLPIPSKGDIIFYFILFSFSSSLAGCTTWWCMIN